MEIAKEILNQLGCNRFILMTGSSNFVSMKNGLGMKLTRNKSKANYMRIVLTPMDLYNVEFLRITSSDMKTIKSIEGIYNDQLQSIFTDVTGL